jgi:phage terminase large subunit-like protein
MTAEQLLAESAELLKIEDKLRYDWRRNARPEQLAPNFDWTVWLLLTGRGWGKTRTGAETTRAWGESARMQIAVIAPTHREARNVCFEAPSAGLLACIPPDQVKRYNRAPGNVELELKNGTTFRAFSAEQPESLRGYAFDKAWCIAKGEIVLTKRGEIPIEDVRVGDLAWTRQGWKPVSATGLTKRAAECIRLIGEHGSLTCTPDHKVWIDGAWRRADQAVPGSSLLGWNLSQGHPGASSGTVNAGTETRRTVTTETAPASFSTSPSGSPITGRSLTGITSITLTTTDRTMSSPTFSWSTTSSIGATTKSSVAAGGKTTRPARRHSAERGSSGTPDSRSNGPVITAAAPTSAPACERNTVRPDAPRPTQPAWQPNSVIRVEPAGTHDVYDITVEDAHEFVANGTLVHNCDEYSSWPMASAQAVWDNLWFTLRESDKAQVVVTTTPKPLPHVKQLYERAKEDPAIVLTRGHMRDNAANLGVEALRQLEHAYSGTRLGRQELAGELMEDVLGALWQLWMFELPGIRLNPTDLPDLERIVVAVDPATTSGEGADASGITVAGCDNGNVLRWNDNPRKHGYVLHSEAFRGLPEATMRRAVSLYRKYRADAIVVENNNGGDYLPAVIRQVDPGVNIKTVFASRGKRARAEPISSLYEQFRVHHVGDPAMFAALEEQMTTWVDAPGQSSPDVLDSAVWGLTELLVSGPQHMGLTRVRDRRLAGRR